MQNRDGLERPLVNAGELGRSVALSERADSSVQSVEEELDVDQLSAAWDMVDWLSREGIKRDHGFAPSDSGAGQAICHHTIQNTAGLIVAGASGKTELMELVLGRGGDQTTGKRTEMLSLARPLVGLCKTEIACSLAALYESLSQDGFAALRKDVHTAGIPVLCASCEARHRGLCGALMPEELVTLASTSTKHLAKPGQELVADSLPVDRYSNVLAGVVKLTKMLPDGRQQIVGLQFAPDFVGRLFQADSNITAEAATNVSLCSFPRRSLESLMQKQPDLERRLLHQTIKELDQAREWMLMLGRKTALEKVASFIQMISQYIDPDRSGQTGVKTFDLPLSRADIADFLGLTIEIVSRQLTKLRVDGVISIVNNRHLTITNAKALAARAGS